VHINRYSSQTLLKLEFFSDVRIILKYQISWKSVHWEPSCSRQADTHYEASSRFSKFYERDLKIVLCYRKTTVLFWTLVWGRSGSIQLHYRKFVRCVKKFRKNDIFLQTKHIQWRTSEGKTLGIILLNSRRKHSVTTERRIPVEI